LVLSNGAIIVLAKPPAAAPATKLVITISLLLKLLFDPTKRRRIKWKPVINKIFSFEVGGVSAWGIYQFRSEISINYFDFKIFRTDKF
jgi:hypothetical protein